MEDVWNTSLLPETSTTSEPDDFWINLDWDVGEKKKKHKKKHKRKKKKARKRTKKDFRYNLIEKTVDTFLCTASDIAKMYARSKFLSS